MSSSTRWVRGVLVVAAVIACVVMLHLKRESAASHGAAPGTAATATARAESGALPRTTPPRRLGLFGVVRSASDRALAGATVCAHRKDERCCSAAACRTTNADGAFAFDELAEGEQVLTAAASEHESNTQLVGKEADREHVTITLRRGGEGLAGVVEDAAGGVIVGALLVATYPDEAERVAGMALSDSEGRFRFTAPPTWLRVSATADGYTLAATETRAPDGNVRLILAPGATLAGRVVEQGTGSPVAGALVTAAKQSGGLDQASVRSDASGFFQLTGLSTGPYEVVGIAEGWRATPRWSTAMLGAPVTDIVLELQPAATLRGTVLVAGQPCNSGLVQLDGPVSLIGRVQFGGKVQVEGAAAGRYALTIGCDGAGELRETLDLATESPARVWNVERGLVLSGTVQTTDRRPAAAAAVTVNAVGASGPGASSGCLTDTGGNFSCAGLKAGSYVCYVQRDGRPVSDVVPVALGDGGATPVALVLRATAAIRVTVRQPDGRPFDRASVTAWRGAEQVGFGRRSGAGELVFEGLPLGTYQVLAVAGPPNRAATTVLLDRDGAEISVTLETPPPVTLRGRVVDEDGGPIPDVLVRAARSSALDPGNDSAASMAMTGADGTFLLRDLLPEEHDVYASGASGEVVVRAVRPGAALDLRMATFGSIAGVVRDRAGKPVRSFVLSYDGAGQARAQRVFDVAGAWRLPWLAPGDWQISVRAAEGVSEQKVALAPGDSRTVALTLTEAGSEPRATEAEAPTAKQQTE